MELTNEELIIPLYGRPHRVSPAGVFSPNGERPRHAVSVVLCQSVLLSPDRPLQETEMVAFRDFRDSAPFTPASSTRPKKPIARDFSGRTEALKQSALELAGSLMTDMSSYDVALRLTALPRVPIFLLFNDRDEDSRPNADCSSKNGPHNTWIWNAWPCWA